MEFFFSTMPLSRQQQQLVDPVLYLAWLDSLVYDLNCPVLFVRGNQQPVLTYYS